MGLMRYVRRIWEQFRTANEIYFLLLLKYISYLYRWKNWKCTVVNHIDSITSHWVWKWIQLAFVNPWIVKGTILVYFPGLFFWWAKIYWPWPQLQTKFMITNEKASKAIVNHIFAFFTCQSLANIFYSEHVQTKEIVVSLLVATNIWLP